MDNTKIDWKFTQDESGFIRDLFNQLQVKVTDPNAGEVISKWQSIDRKLTNFTEVDLPKNGEPAAPSPTP